MKTTETHTTILVTDCRENESTDKPQNTCPHCGSGLAFDSPWEEIQRDWTCGSIEGRRDDLCCEREARQKAQAEVERLKRLLNRSMYAYFFYEKSEDELRKIMRCVSQEYHQRPE